MNIAPYSYTPATGALVKIAKGTKYRLDKVLVPAGGTFQVKGVTTSGIYLQIKNVGGVSPAVVEGPFLLDINQEDATLGCDVADLVVWGDYETRS